MSIQMKLAVAGTALSLSLLGGCATKHVSPADRDTTGTYDGVWVGTVGKPRASRVTLPGNWIMTCDWEPFHINMTVADGKVRLNKAEVKTPVSTKGDFRIDVPRGAARMNGGVMPGNSGIVDIYSGNLADSSPHGKVTQYITTVGSNGCSADIEFRRRTGSST